MATCKIKRGATLPKFRVTLLDPENPRVGYNLTGSTVQFRMRLKGTDTVAASGSATLVDAANGVVEYAWQASDTAIAGEYDADWRVTQGGDLGIWPSEEYDRVVIEDDVGS